MRVIHRILSTLLLRILRPASRRSGRAAVETLPVLLSRTTPVAPRTHTTEPDSRQSAQSATALESFLASSTRSSARTKGEAMTDNSYYTEIALDGALETLVLNEPPYATVT